MKTPRLLFAVLVLALGCQRPAPTTDTAAATADAAACIDPSKIKADAICTMQYDPVCGCDGKTYSNDCVASNAGVRTYTKGPCPEAKPK